MVKANVRVMFGRGACGIAPFPGSIRLKVKQRLLFDAHFQTSPLTGQLSSGDVCGRRDGAKERVHVVVVVVNVTGRGE